MMRNVLASMLYAFVSSVSVQQPDGAWCRLWTQARLRRGRNASSIRFGRGLIAIGFLSLGALPFEDAVSAERERSHAPRYTESGELIPPQRFDTWVFVGSNLGLAYKPDLPNVTALEAARAERPEFHNVYINPEAYKHFRETGEFPNLTVLVMEKFKAEDREPGGVLAKGQFDGERMGFEVAVKNLARPDGSKTPWAYYDFTGPKQSAKAFEDKDCEACHHTHAGKDNVWIQLYPRLRDRSLE